MRRRHAPFAVPFIGLMVASWAQAAARDLTFEDRVKAQEAIERVYYSHQVGATKRFEMAVPRSLLEQKVRTYLRQSVALERLWHTPVTAEALRGELGRMARQTRAPERLRELYEALHGDAGLIEECLARPLLVDRLTRNFFAYDDRIHAETRRAAEHLRGRLLSADLDPDADDPRRSVVDVVRSATGRAGGLVAGRRSPHATESGPPRMELTPDEYVRWRAEIPARPGEVGPVAQTADAFVIRTLLAEDAARTRVATYVVPKITWDAWWQSAAVEMDDARARTVASPLDPLPLPSTASETGGPQDATALCETDDTWIDGGLADEAPHAGDGQSVVWTGSVMVVWGGLYVTDFETYLNTGSRYDPATDTWASTSTRNAPCGRYGQAAVWTGSEMIVWGGEIACGDNSGGRYDPFSDTWTPVSTLDAPPNGGSQTAVWTGSEMIVWGGDDPTGGRYDPARDSWLPIATLGAPSGRSEQTAVWTGREMLIWGGAACVTTCDQLNTGARYDPASDTWSAISTLGAPSPRWSHTAVWTGSEMLIWGGFSNTADAGRSGGRYDPGRDSWSPITTTAAPAGVSLGAGAVWTGRYMVVGAGGASTGGRYDASADVWLPVSNRGSAHRRPLRPLARRLDAGRTSERARGPSRPQRGLDRERDARVRRGPGHRRHRSHLLSERGRAIRPRDRSMEADFDPGPTGWTGGPQRRLDRRRDDRMGRPVPILRSLLCFNHLPEHRRSV